ncbi:Phenylserine dehydratase [compost metagenome]
MIEDSTFTFDTIITPVGGGGLLSGTSLSAHYFSPSTKVVGAEPEGAADAVLSFKSGKVEKPPYISSIADGLLTTLSERTLAIIREHVSEILLANDEEIAAAMKLIWERMKIIVEPSSAVALAVIIKNKERFAGQRIGIIISGGNVDLATLPF